MRVFSTFEELDSAVGEELGTSDWLTVDQTRIDAFADCTGDHQWIHVDPVRSADGPFGTTIAHGFLTLSLVPMLGAEIYLLDTPGPKLNYGANKLRFPSPVPVGSRIRAHARLLAVTELPAGRQVIVGYTVEIEGTVKPACVIETVALLLSV